MTRSTFAKIRGSLHRTRWQTSSINHPDAKHFGPTASILDLEQKTEKRCKSCRTYGNRSSVAFGCFFLMISTGAWKRASPKTLGLFHSYTQRRQRLTYFIGEKMRFLVDRSHPLWK
jgi:hypothetical protein